MIAIKLKNLMPKLFVVTSAVLLNACAEQLVKPLDLPLSKHITVLSARETPNADMGKRVRWGGLIAKVENHKAYTELVIVDRPLDRRGRPIDSDTSGGRFVADVPGFLEPTIFAPGREITVVGKIKGNKKGMVGQYEYEHPEINVEVYKLWKQEEQVQYYPVPYYWYGGMGSYYYPWYY